MAILQMEKKRQRGVGEATATGDEHTAPEASQQATKLKSSEKKRKTGEVKVNQDQVRKAVVALQTWLESREQNGKGQLLDPSEFVHLGVAFKHTPEKRRRNPFAVEVPHSLYPLNASREVCLIVKDEGGAGHKSAKEKVRSAGKQMGITRVLGVAKLKSKYGPHEAKRQLCGSYDLFLADNRVLPVLPKLLGKTFFIKKKHPIPVELRRGDWITSIRKACDSTYLYISGGDCSVVKVAYSDWSVEQIVENVLAAIEGIAEVVPGKWDNIQGLYLKSQDSVALPIYAALPAEPTKMNLPSEAAVDIKKPLSQSMKKRRKSSS